MLKWFRGTYRTLNTVRIDATALRDNLKKYRKRYPRQSICPVLKANAYGHGLLQVAHIVDTENVDFLVVDSLYEAYELQKANITSPILILGYTLPENLTLKRLPFHFVAGDLETVRVLADQKANVHLKIDTGMNRMGFKMEELPLALKLLKRHSLNVVGLCTHFADADNTDSTTTRDQLKKFREARTLVQRAGFAPQWFHVGGGGGGAMNQDLKGINMVRLGISLYGVAATRVLPKTLTLKPVMEVVSTVVGLRQVQRGESVSYNGTFTAPKPMTLATVPFGYYEGLPRALSNKGVMSIHGKICPIVGRICMNYTVIDVTGLKKIATGDEVQVISPDPKAPNSFVQLAKQADTIPYELMVRLAASIRREVI